MYHLIITEAVEAKICEGKTQNNAAQIISDELRKRGVFPPPLKIQNRNHWTLKQVRQAYGLKGGKAA